MYSCGFYFGVSEHFSCALNSVLLVPCLLKVKAERLRSNIFPYDHCVKLHKLVVEHCCPLLTCYLMSVFFKKPEKTREGSSKGCDYFSDVPEEESFSIVTVRGH